MPVHQCCAKLEKYVQPLHMSHMHTTTSATADYTCSVLGYYSADFIQTIFKLLPVILFFIWNNPQCIK